MQYFVKRIDKEILNLMNFIMIQIVHLMSVVMCQSGRVTLVCHYGGAFRVETRSFQEYGQVEYQPEQESLMARMAGIKMISIVHFTAFRVRMLQRKSPKKSRIGYIELVQFPHLNFELRRNDLWMHLSHQNQNKPFRFNQNMEFFATIKTSEERFRSTCA